MDLWSYKIARDYGFAPNPFYGFCTLACCKPNIRRQAVTGDLIVGCGSSKPKLVGRLIFAMRVTETLTFQQYWDDERFARRKPLYTAGKARAFGDNIYHKDGNDNWLQEDSHHSFAGGVWNADNADRDLSANRVLISNDFVYWGNLAPEIPAELRSFDENDLYPERVRDYRRHYSDPFKAKADEWFQQCPRGRSGRPISWK
jgi:hypothetical protein